MQKAIHHLVFWHSQEKRARLRDFNHERGDLVVEINPADINSIVRLETEFAHTLRYALLIRDPLAHSFFDTLFCEDDKIFEKCVNAQRNNKPVYAQAYAGELAQVRKMKNMVSGAKLSMEQVKLRLDTVSELGDVVVTLSPCMSIIKGLSPSLSGIMPEANASMQDLSQILGDVMSGSSVGMEDNFTTQTETNSDTLAILEEAHNVIAGQTKSSIPEVPTELRQQVAQKKADIFI